jgi:hypothetical protein
LTIILQLSVLKNQFAKTFLSLLLATHLITLHTNKSPNGTIKVALCNKVPDWIGATHSDSDGNILKDSTHTIGLKYLTDGIVEAYESMTLDQNIADFKIEIH